MRRIGLRSVAAVLDGERAADFAALLADLEREIAPTSRLERELVRDLAVALWRRRRCATIESGVLATRRAEVELLHAGIDTARAHGRRWRSRCATSPSA